MKDVLKFSIPGQPEYIQTIKLAVGSIAGTADFSMEAIEDLKIAVAEACKNVTCHGFDGFSNMYEVTCELEEDKITILVADKAMEHGLEKTHKPCLDCPNEGDLGVYVMKTLVDAIELNSESKDYRSIKLVKNKC